MVGLPVTSEICGVAVCSFMLFYDGYKVKASSIHTSICHLGKLLSRSHFSIWDLFSPLLPLVLSFSLFFFLSLFLSFLLEFVSFFLSVFPKHIVLLHSLLQRTQKLNYPNAALSVILKKRVSSSSDRIK